MAATNPPSAALDTATVAVDTAAPVAAATRPKKHHTFMLHSVVDGKAGAGIGKFSSATARQAALKAVTRVCKEIDVPQELHLRATNSRIVKVFIGSKATLPTPQVVERSGRVITYKTRAHVKLARTYVFGEDEPMSTESVSGETQTS